MIWLDELIGLARLIVGGVTMPRRPTAELIAGEGISLDATDDEANARTLVTITAPGGGGTGAIAVNQEGIPIIASATALNFIGSSVAIGDAGGGVASVTISGGGGGGALSEVLAAGNVTGSRNIVLSSGDSVQGTDAALADDPGGPARLAGGVALGSGAGGSVSISGGNCDSGAIPGDVYLLPGQSANETPVTGKVLVNSALQLADITMQAALDTPVGSAYLYVEGNELKFKDTTGVVRLVAFV